MGKKLALGKGIASLLQETPNQILRSNLSDVPEINTGSNNISSQQIDNGKTEDFSSLGNFISIDKITTIQNSQENF